MMLWVDADNPCPWCGQDTRHWHSVRNGPDGYMLGNLIRTDQPPVESTLVRFTQEPEA